MELDWLAGQQYQVYSCCYTVCCQCSWSFKPSHRLHRLSTLPLSGLAGVLQQYSPLHCMTGRQQQQQPVFTNAAGSALISTAACCVSRRLGSVTALCSYVLQAEKLYGPAWAKIADLLPGRTNRAVKNLFNCRLKQGAWVPETNKWVSQDWRQSIRQQHTCMQLHLLRGVGCISHIVVTAMFPGKDAGTVFLNSILFCSCDMSTSDAATH